MRWPQIVMLIAVGFNIAIALIKDGEPKDGDYDFGRTLIASVIEIIILGAGGFWKTE